MYVYVFVLYLFCCFYYQVRIAAVKGREMHNKALALMTEFHQKAEGVVEAIELIKEFSDEGVRVEQRVNILGC